MIWQINWLTKYAQARTPRHYFNVVVGLTPAKNIWLTVYDAWWLMANIFERWGYNDALVSWCKYLVLSCCLRKLHFLSSKFDIYLWTQACFCYPLGVEKVTTHNFMKTKWRLPELAVNISITIFVHFLLLIIFFPTVCPLHTHSFCTQRRSRWDSGLKWAIFSVMQMLLMLASGLIMTRTAFTNL